MTQMERIQHMESILDEAADAVKRLLDDLERYEAIKPGLAELEAYYSSGQWMKDYEDDCAGKLPEGLKRGVLSEDAVYNLLQMQDELKKAFKNQCGV